MFSALQNEGEIADRGAVEAGDNPVVQEHCGAGRIGAFKERECEAAHIDASERETGQSRCGKQKKIMPGKRTELRRDPFPAHQSWKLRKNLI